MEYTGKNRKEFAAYEYKEVTADINMASFLLDGYENFGWETDDNLSGINPGNCPESKPSPYQKKVCIHLKRNRKIINKMELTRLQRNFEACVSEIAELEKSKTSIAAMYAIICGILGTAFMAGSTFAVTAQTPHIVLCILLAVPGFLGWILPYFIYKKVEKRQTGRVKPIIEGKYEEIYEICEKGHKLQ